MLYSCSCSYLIEYISIIIASRFRKKKTNDDVRRLPLLDHSRVSLPLLLDMMSVKHAKPTESPKATPIAATYRLPNDFAAVMTINANMI